MEAKKFLPSWLYECVRYAVCVALPSIASFLAALNEAWGWGWPIDAILITFSSTEALLGALFVIAKAASKE